MNYKLLQVGDVTQERDEVWLAGGRGWRRVACPGAIIDDSYAEKGNFYRRPVRRTDIEIVAPDDGESGFWVSLKNAEEFDLEDDNYTLSVPIAYAQKVIDAIKEVAGL